MIGIAAENQTVDRTVRVLRAWVAGGPMKWRLRQWAREPPFPSPLDDSRSVLAVKGPLRRFAPWMAPGRSEGMAVYEGKRGGRAVWTRRKGTFRSYQTP